MPPFPRGLPGVASIALFLLASVLLVVGWWEFWFLTDDAYIAFRYISNSMLGFGLVWNPPPFLPVEGYTSFLWILLLEGVWRVFGYEPPASCNLLSLGFSFLSLGLTALMALRMDPGSRLRRHRVPVLGLVLLGAATNRTFLTWSSSGLETAMFNAFVLAWIYALLFVDEDRPFRLPLVSLVAGLIYLTRPDGILFVAATVLLAVLRYRSGERLRSIAAGLFPVVLLPLHLGWRKSFYGEWLPNSYYAKYAGAWPESGLRYALSFILEYALWTWMLFAVILVLLTLRRRTVTRSEPTVDSREIHGPRRLEVGLVVAVLACHFAYYTLIIGGDHFEYRVYSHLIPLFFLALVRTVGAMELRAGPAIALIVVAVILTYPVPYTHWLASRGRTTRQETFKMCVPLEGRWPGLLDAYARWFDRTQFWLIDHYVCMRHQEHKANLAYIESLFPTRDRGRLVPADGFPVMSFPAVGYASWVLPHVAFLDTHGINDHHVARTPVPRGRKRAMAHDRQPPPGYLECFDPNVRLRSAQEIEVVERRHPMTATRIRSCEELWLRRVPLLEEQGE